MTEKTVTAPAKPARSPVERAIVWTVILVGLLAVAVEASAHFTHSAALAKLNSKLEEFETGEKDGGVTEADVKSLLGNREPVTSEKLPAGTTAMGADRLDIYEYKGLFRTRPIYVYYGIQGKQGQAVEVMIVRTSPSETLSEAMAKMPPLPPPDPTLAGGPGPGGMRAGGPGPGGPRPANPGPSGRPAVEDAETKSGDKKVTDVDKKDGETKPEEAKPEEAKKEEPKAEEPKKEEPKADEAKKDA